MASASSSLRRVLSHRNQRPHTLRRHPPPLTNPTPPPWRRPLPRLLASFILGLLLGVSPFPSPPDADVPPRTFFPSDPTPRGGARVIETVKSVQLHVVARPFPSGEPARSLLIVVTPTYNRALQAYYLTRLGQTLWLVRPPLLWIVVEVGAASPETADVLRRTGVMYRHLVSAKDSGDVKDRGVRQRNAALEHIERHNLNGVVYFADDDNVYSVELFEEMRGTRRFGTWPVAMLAQSKSKAILEGPVCSGSKIIGWHTNEKSKRLRRFHVDMSGFAFNSTILWDRKHWRHSSSKAIRQLDTVKEGFQETTFIEQVVEDEGQMEAVPYNCSKIMNWHLHLDARNLAYPKGWKLSRNLEVVVPLHYM